MQSFLIFNIDSHVMFIGLLGIASKKGFLLKLYVYLIFTSNSPSETCRPLSLSARVPVAFITCVSIIATCFDFVFSSVWNQSTLKDDVWGNTTVINFSIYCNRQVIQLNLAWYMILILESTLENICSQGPYSDFSWVSLFPGFINQILIFLNMLKNWASL